MSSWMPTSDRGDDASAPGSFVTEQAEREGFLFLGENWAADSHKPIWRLKGLKCGRQRYRREHQ